MMGELEVPVMFQSCLLYVRGKELRLPPCGGTKKCTLGSILKFKVFGLYQAEPSRTKPDQHMVRVVLHPSSTCFV